MMTTTKKKPKKKIVVKVEEEKLDIDKDPRRQAFAAAYLDPTSNTYSNALQSAIKVGFSPEYAKDILFRNAKWLQEITGKLGILDDLHRNFKEHVNISILVPAMGPFGPLIDKKTKKPLMVESNTRLKMRQEITMFGLEKLDPAFKKADKNDIPPQTVVITQVIIKDPNGGQIIYDANSIKNNSGAESTPEAGGGIPAAA